MQEQPLHFKTIAEVASLIETKQLSPVELTEGVATSLVALLVGGSVVLAPSIILHHAVRAADAEDRQAGR